MKTMMIVMLCAAVLLAAGTAHAYAIYNHSDQTVCITKWYSVFTCHVTVRPHSTHNGEHGAGLKKVCATWIKHDHCYCSDTFSIPKGGYARIYNHELKVYDHHGKHKDTKDIPQVDCHEIDKRPK